MKHAIIVAAGKIEETSHILTMIEPTPDDLREIENADSRVTVQSARRLSAPSIWGE